MTAIVPPQTVPTPTAPRASLLRRLSTRPLGFGALIFVGLVSVLAVIGPWIAPQDPNKATLDMVLSGPSATHPLGADSAGRDVLSRILAATQISIAAAILALVTALVIGVVAGLIAGYYGGWFDSAASWFTSLIMALPAMVVLLASRAVLGPSVWLAMLVFGVLLSPAYFRLVYAAVTAVRHELYIDAAKVAGLSDLRIIGRHIPSVVRAPIIIQSAIIAGIAIAIQSGLEFLGLGDASVPTWGQMLNDAFTNIYRAPTLMLWPSLAITLTCVALTLLANAMRDELERTASARRRRPPRALSRTGGSTAQTRPAEAEHETIAHPDDAHSSEGSRQPVLTIEGLRIGYIQADGSDLEVVHGVSLQVRRGEVHGLIGESGSGKSQTAFATLGLLPRGGQVTGGTIRYGATTLHGASEHVYSSVRGVGIGYIPQEPMSNLDPSFKIGSQLVEPLRLKMGLSRKEATEKSLALLERVGIPNPRRTFDAYPFEVSGGMAQRVLIAGAVALDPDLIIADEPTTALDVTVQAEVLDLLRDLQRERGMAMLLVTHNFGVVADLCDRVTVMQEGRFVEQGPVRTILTAPTHPYTRALLSAILDEGPARPPLASTTGARR